MFSLVADYGNSEDESSVESSIAENSDESVNLKGKQTFQMLEQTTLPSASLMLATDKAIPGGVFSNPFREAEDAKIACLEKHVKMVDPESKTSEQKRNICWNFRKGRCRFGSKCNYVHDSDLIVNKGVQGNQINIETADKLVEHSSLSIDNRTTRKHDSKKKRPGLSRELVPPRKVLKMYQKSKFSGKP
ncbi:uncharacterized protein LOC131439332 [Malaya genurostris]|uniref:uncharacterized protein LOC131439332 n=1 Tax=Malaya genurostris TaxID=325434 RepID=UPI0026F3BDB5|nr:uncharacterized protein LOC131439332 [Malaya genurostris]